MQVSTVFTRNYTLPKYLSGEIAYLVFTVGVLPNGQYINSLEWQDDNGSVVDFTYWQPSPKKKRELFKKHNVNVSINYQSGRDNPNIQVTYQQVLFADYEKL